MTTYSYYTGVTAYFKQNPKNEARFRMLADAIPALQAHVDMTHRPKITFADVLKFAGVQLSEKFTELREFAYLVEQDGQNYPIDTPDAYQHASITHCVIKSHPLTRLHLPLVDASKNNIDYAIQYLLFPLLDQLFEGDLISMKTRATDESGYFAEAQDCIFVSAENQKARTA